MPSYIKTNNSLTVVFDDGESVTMYKPEMVKGSAYSDFEEAVKAKEWETARAIATPAAAIKAAASREAEEGDVRITDGIVYYKNQPMHGTLTTRMIEMLNEGYDIKPMFAFMTNLMQNPSYRAVTELYDFLEASNLPITDDGCFLAYKRIDSDYKDLYTHKIDNSVGAVVEMERNCVDEDKARTCSNGLHFCSREYLPRYGVEKGNKVVVVKINPRDVVAIPEDYNNAKGRCCRYEVIQNLDIDLSTEEYYPEETLERAYAPSAYKVEEIGATDDDMIEMLDDGEVINTFPSIASAAEWMEIDPSNIRKVIKGLRQSAGGYQWRLRQVWGQPADDDDDYYSTTPTINRAFVDDDKGNF